MRIVAVLLIIVVLSISSFFIWRSTKIAPSKSAVLQFFAPGTNWYQADIFGRQMEIKEKIQVELVWGLKLADVSKCHKHDFKCYGKLQFDDQLDLNLWQAQLSLLDFCKRLESDELANKLHIKRINGKSLVDCFLHDMHRDMLYQRNPKVYKCTDGKPLDLTIPIGQVKRSRLMSCRPELYGNPTVLKEMALDLWFDRNIETVIYYWLKHSKIGQNLPTESRMRSYSRIHVALEYARFLNDSRRISNLMPRWSYTGRIGVMHIAVTLNQTTSVHNYRTGLPVKDIWERFMQENNAKFPLGLRGAFPCMFRRAPRSPLSAWTWFEVQEALWNNARIGIALGLFVVALPILLLSTRNVLLALVGVICLVFVISAVMAMAQLMGWSLGVSESINFCVSTGLSVDYVIHFLEVYHRSSAMTRRERVYDMLTQMGGAVSSGAVTTVGATSFLFASSLLFFQQFGAFMATSLGCAYLYSLFLLTPLLVLFGPEGETGSLDPLIERMLKAIKSCHNVLKAESAPPVIERSSINDPAHQ